MKRNPRSWVLTRILPMSLAALMLVLLAFLLSGPSKRPAQPPGNKPVFPYTKIVRLQGGPEEVRQALWRAVYLEDTGPEPTEELSSWVDVVQTHVWIQPTPTHVMVLPDEGRDSLAWALPGAYWAVQNGYPIVFTARDRLEPEAAQMLQRYQVPAFVAAPETMISRQTLRQIRTLVPAVRIARKDVTEHAAAIAEFRQHSQSTRWMMSPTLDHECVVTVPRDARQALAALPLARSHAAILLYVRENGQLPLPMEKWVSQAGPGKRYWVVGDHIRPEAIIRLEDARALGSLWQVTVENLARGSMLGLIILGLAGGAFVAAVGCKAGVPFSLQQCAWILTASLLPVFGPWLYIRGNRSANFRPHRTERVAFSFGFGAPVMMGASYGLVALDMPGQFGDWIQGWGFLLGTGLALMIAAAWTGIVFLAWIVLVAPRLAAYSRVPNIARSILRVMLTIFSISLGMISMALGLQGIDPPFSGESGWARLAALWAATWLGFLIAWLFHYPLEARNVLRRPTVFVSRAGEPAIQASSK